MAPVTIPQLLATFPAFGDRPLFVTPSNRLTYADAEARSAGLARRLLAAGLGKNSRVAIVLGNGTDWVVTYFALTRIGAHAILLNPFARAPELAYALRHSDAAAAVTGVETGGASAAELFTAAVPALDGHDGGSPLFATSHPYLRRVWWLGPDKPGWAVDPAVAAPVAPELLAMVEAEVSAADPVLTSYTSGTTAEPKAVTHSQGAVLRQADKLAACRAFTAADVVCTPMPLFWIGGVCFALLSAATRGCRVVTDARFDAGRALDLMEHEGVTTWYGWPQAAESLVTHPSWPERDLSGLRVGPAVLRGAAFAGVAVDQRDQSLGMTETCGPHTWPLDSDAILPDHMRGAFGVPVPRMEHRIVDRDTGEPVPRGEIGELVVRGECLMLGFHKRERQDTFDADGWYHTGDLCSWRDERLFFHGRGGDMIKTAGFNVAPAEVERVIDAMPDVMHVVVLGLPDDVRGQVVGALVALRPGSDETADSLAAKVKEQVSSYKVPTVWRLVDQPTYPMGVTGKVERSRAIALIEEARA